MEGSRWLVRRGLCRRAALAFVLSSLVVVGACREGAKEAASAGAPVSEAPVLGAPAAEAAHALAEVVAEGESAPAQEMAAGEAEEPARVALAAHLARALLSEPLLVALVQPEQLARDLEQAVLALSQVDAESAERLRRLLARGLGDFVALLQPGGWDAGGVDVGHPLLLQVRLESSDAARLDGCVREIVAGVDDEEVRRQLVSCEELMRQTALRLRLVLPTRDAALALAFVERAVAALGGTPEEVAGGFSRRYVLGDGLLLAVGQSEGMVLLETVVLPWYTVDEGAAHLARVRAVLGEMSLDQGSQPAGLGPRSSAVTLYAYTWLGALRTLNGLMVLLSRADEAGERGAAVRVSDAFWGEAGVFDVLDVEVSAGQEVWIRTRFKSAPAALAALKPMRWEPQHAGPLLSASFAPQVAALRGPWVEAGLGAADLNLGELLQALGSGHGVLPLFFPLWLPHLPSLVWRDVVPAAARYIDPGLIESIEVSVLPHGERDAIPATLALFDTQGELAVHRHGLACLSQRRPVQGACADERITIGQIGVAQVAGRGLHYHLQEEDGDVRMVIGTNQESVALVVGAPRQRTSALARLQMDLPGLAGSALGQRLGAPSLQAARRMGRVSAEVGVRGSWLQWELRLDPPMSPAEVIVVGAPALLDYVRRSQEVESVANLEAIAVAAVAYREGVGNGTYPLAPAAKCSAGAMPEGERVAPSASDWQEAPWRQLAFSVPYPHLYRYCYQSFAEGERFAAWAEAALDGGAIDSVLCLTSEVNAYGEATVGHARRLEAGVACH